MKEFAQLINTLDSTNKTTLKQEAISQFLKVGSNSDKLWLLALLTGKRPKRNINSSLMKQWAMEIANIPEWLFVESYSSVGDLAETLSLLISNTQTNIEYSLTEWMDIIKNLGKMNDDEKKEFVTYVWKNLDYIERFIFNKLIGGSFRIGVSSKILINTIAKDYNLDSSAVAHSIMGEWDLEKTDFDKLVRGEYTNTQRSKPYPFCLAYPLEKELGDLGLISEWQIEYKWDGIRGQFIKRDNEVFIWSRGEELVTEQFPELIEVFERLEGNFVMDGEIVAIKEGEVLNFNELQKRLNRKVISKKLKDEIPISVILYDLLEINGLDYRNSPIKERRLLLEELVKTSTNDRILLSEIIEVNSWDSLNEVRNDARLINSEGLMLKHKLSPYHTGRKKGDWWKWKIDPLTIDAVLVYAQKGSGRRSGFYTDYTFAVKNNNQLVTIAKAYSGLTDKEIQEVSRYISKNTLEKFGPVRTVKPELVFEIGFEGISFSSRHKSGVALRFPRILKWRKDKKVDDIDDLEEVKKLIQ